METAAADGVGMYFAAASAEVGCEGMVRMHPLNGPAWSLYYEYIANILYALFVRRFSKTALAVLVAVAACFTVYHSQLLRRVIWWEAGR